MHDQLIENVYTFGQDGGLIGVLTRKAGDRKQTGQPAVLIWNAGLLHHVGPYRLFVDFSRQLALQGFPAFRFDLTGYGDSSGFILSLPDKEQAQQDIQEAVNFLSERFKIKSFVLLGLCSGADQAFKYAINDERITGLVSLDGYAYPTMVFYLHYLVHLFKTPPVKILHFLKRRFFPHLSPLEKSKLEAANEATWWVLPPKKNVLAGLQQLINRKVKMFFIYSAGVKDNYNYRDQFRDMFRELNFKGLADYEYNNQADHLYYRLPVRNKMIGMVLRWMNRQFPLD